MEGERLKLRKQEICELYVTFMRKFVYDDIWILCRQAYTTAA